MKKYLKLNVVAGLCLLGLLLQGCTKEKAEAIKVAANNFRAQANAAFDQIRDILKQNIAMPPMDNDKLAVDLCQTNFSYEMLQELMSEGQVETAAATQTDKKIDDIETQYNTFAKMFDALPQGHFFAAQSVAQSERFSVNLTLQMINIAGLIQKQKIPVRLNAKRILLVEQIKKDNAISDPKIRQDLLKNDAKQVTALAVEEAQIRDQAIVQCLKASETGRLVSSLIRDYKNLSVGEILTLTQQSLGAVADMSGQIPDVVSILKQYQTVATTIQNDPYWSRLLDEKIQITPNQ